jgi:hypothetical protein
MNDNTKTVIDQADKEVTITKIIEAKEKSQTDKAGLTPETFNAYLSLRKAFEESARAESTMMRLAGA